MAKYVLLDPVITINGVDLTDHASSATIEGTADEVDLTAFQSDYREFAQGLKDATITVSFFQDFAAAEVDATLQPLFAAGSTFAVAIKADNAAISATNPEYQMTARMFSYSPIAGAVGEASTTDVTFRNASQTGLVRDVTP